MGDPDVGRYGHQTKPTTARERPMDEMDASELLAVLKDAEAGLAPAGGFGAAIVQLETLVAEWDRLRAVVDAVRRWRSASPGDEAGAAIQAMEDALGQLDGSPDTGGTRSTEGAPHESDGDGPATSGRGAPDPPNGGPVPPSTPAPQPVTPDMGDFVNRVETFEMGRRPDLSATIPGDADDETLVGAPARLGDPADLGAGDGAGRDVAGLAGPALDDAFYVCPDHNATGGYESCCQCGGWAEDDPDRGRLCTEANDA